MQKPQMRIPPSNSRVGGLGIRYTCTETTQVLYVGDWLLQSCGAGRRLLPGQPSVGSLPRILWLGLSFHSVVESIVHFYAFPKED